MPDGMGPSKGRTCPTDRRGARRYTLNWVVKVTAADSAGEIEQAATLRNLSSTGALAFLQASPQVGDRLLVAFKLPFEREIWMRYAATVIRVEQEAAGAGVALKFDKSRPEFTQTQS